MSGPKVVRIVSREEIEAICGAHAREVARAADALARTARRHGRFDAELERELQARNALIAQLTGGERWMDVQKQGPAIVAFLKGETKRIEAAAIDDAAAARSKRRRLRSSASTLIAASEAAGAGVATDLRRAASGTLTVSQAEAAVEAALKTLTAASRPAMPKTSRELAARLGTGEGEDTLEAWLARRAPLPDAGIPRLDRALAELETIAGREAAAAFADRADAATREPSEGKRALLVDSMVLEMGRAVAAHRAVAAEIERTEAALAGLEALASARGAGLAEELRAAPREVAALAELASRASALLAAETADQAASARRRAVLSGLAELGYEVRPSMATALAEGGRVVVRRPRSSDYGVEIAAPGGAARIQVRLVGAATPTAPRTSLRDRDEETLWCGDVDRLRGLIAGAGGDLMVERAVAAGAEPVKSAVFDRDGDAAADAARDAPAQRSIR